MRAKRLAGLDHVGGASRTAHSVAPAASTDLPRAVGPVLTEVLAGSGHVLLNLKNRELNREWQVRRTLAGSTLHVEQQTVMNPLKQQDGGAHDEWARMLQLE